MTSALGIPLARCCKWFSVKPEKSLRNRYDVKGQSHGTIWILLVLNILKNDLSTPQVLFCKMLHLSVSMGLEISFSIIP